MNLLLVTYFDPNAIGGVSSAVRRLSEELGEQGHRVSILAPGKSKRLQGPFGDDFRFYTLYLRSPVHSSRRMASTLKFSLLAPYTIGQLVKLSKLEKLDAVFLQYPTASAVCLGVARKLTKWKLIATFQGSDAHRIEEWTGLNAKAMRVVLRNADHVTAVASSLASKVQAWFPDLTTPISVIPNGASDRCTPCGIANDDVDLPSKFILSAGHLINRKGFDVLIPAFAKARDADASTHLVVAGDGEEADRLRDLAAEYNVADFVHFMGWRNDQQLSELMQRCEFFVLASRAEGLPLVIAEAMLAGKTVVATDVDGIPDIVLDGRTGVLVPPDDDDRLAGALRSFLIDKSARDAMATAAQRYAAENYTWNVIAHRYLALVESA